MRRAFVAVVAIVLVAAFARVHGQSGSSTATDTIMRCTECGRIESIREIQETRASAPPGTSSELPIGLVMYLPVGRPTAAGNERYIGSVGSRQWQERASVTRYEISVRLDSGAYQVLQRQGASEFSAGDRVKVTGGQIEHWPPR